MFEIAHVNGKLLKKADAVIQIHDLGLLRGFAVFDFFRAVKGRPFMVADHAKRFVNSARLLGINHSYTESEIIKASIELLNQSGLQEAGIRLLLTGGYSEDGFKQGDPNFIGMIEKLSPFVESNFENGVKLMAHHHLRELAEIKTTNYITAVQLQPKRLRENAYDILYYYDNKILEVTRSNFFIIKGNTLITPKENILKGITRKKVLELCKSEFEIEERDVLLSELSEADEAFLTGTTKKVMPVVQVDEIVIKNGKRGEKTLKIQKLFSDFEKSF